MAFILGRVVHRFVEIFLYPLVTWFNLASNMKDTFLGLPAPILFVTSAAVAFLVSVIFARRCCVPLSEFPGPFLWSISRLPMFYYLCAGRLPYKIAELHAKYGPVVRVAPTELSFNNEDAWWPIYAKQVNKPQLKKDPTLFVRPSSGIGGLLFEQSDVAHGRIRRNFSHAFSEKSMREQEPIIRSYIDLFISRLQENAGKPIDICKWYTCLTFDIIGDLAFGDSFQSLENSNLHPWIKTIFETVAAMTVLGMVQKFEPFSTLFFAMLPRSLRKAEITHKAFTAAKLRQRLEIEGNRPDFITHVKKFLNTPTGITLLELQETCNNLIIGGSETTSTVLSGCTYFLLTNTRVRQKLTAEIRSTFTSSSEITMMTVQKLEYQLAVLNETLRLFSPTPGNLTRVVSRGGCMISGYNVPGGTLVGVSPYAAGHANSNFARTKEFIPERWMRDAPAEFNDDKLKAIQAFSIGPRNCIGKNLAYMEMRLILARVLYDFDFELQEQSKNWMDMKAYGFFQKQELMIKLTPVAH